MPRLSNADRRRVRAFVEDVETFRIGQGPLLERIGALRELLGIELGLAYSGTPLDGECRLDFAYLSDVNEARSRLFRRGLEQWLSESSARWAFFNPTRPEPFQRNRALAIGTYAMLREGRPTWGLTLRKLSPRKAVQRHALEALRLAAPVFETTRTEHHHQLRALVCDGGSLLSWVGGLHPEPITTQQRLRLAAIVPALQRRLLLERRLARTRLQEAALEAALGELPGRALIVVGGRVEGANVAGRALLEGNRCLRNGAAEPDRFRRVRLKAQGWPDAELWIEELPASAINVRAAAGRYGLTPRETQVVELVAHGLTNHAIAAELRCSPRTIEVHVSNVLDKAGCQSRAALIAKLAST